MSCFKQISVVPAQAGIHSACDVSDALWIPACAGTTKFLALMCILNNELNHHDRTSQSI
jgi:hypothetical protein